MCKSVLLVDDDANIRENYRDILEDQGLQVMDCGKSIEALATFETRSFDLVVLDISLHGDRMAGHHICQHIRLRNPAVPVLMLTSLDDAENRLIAAKNGSSGYLVKSADTEEFITSVKKICRIQEK